MKNIRRAGVLGDLAEDLDNKRKDNLKDAFDKLKNNNKLELLKNIIRLNVQTKIVNISEILKTDN